MYIIILFCCIGSPKIQMGIVVPSVDCPLVKYGHIPRTILQFLLINAAICSCISPGNCVRRKCVENRRPGMPWRTFYVGRVFMFSRTRLTGLLHGGSNERLCTSSWRCLGKSHWLPVIIFESLYTYSINWCFNCTSTGSHNLKQNKSSVYLR